MATLKDLVKLGYTVGVAFGDAQPEHDRLAELKAATEPGALEAAAADVAASVADAVKGLELQAVQRAEIVARATADALAQLQEAAVAALEHQERAVKIAEGMVTVWRVEGFGLSMLVAEDDQDTLASLANKKAHAERVAQHDG